MDMLAALGYSRQSLQALKQKLSFFLALLLLCHHSCGHFIRLNVNLACETIYDTVFTGQLRIQIDISGNDTRNIHHTRQNSGMRVGGSLLGNQRQDLVLLKLYGLAGGQILCHDDHRLRHCLCAYLCTA